MVLLDERVTFQRKTLVQNEYGTLVETADDIATVWASVKAKVGNELDRGQQTQATSNYLVTIRNRTDLTESDVIVWRSHELNIRFIRDSGPRPLYLEIEAERGVPA